MLKVININSTIDLTRHDCAFIEQVIFMAEEVDAWEHENSISSLLNKIPVYLLNEDSMPPGDAYEDENGGDNSNTEYLGFYDRIKCRHIDFVPAIFICPERIFLASKQKIGYQELLAKVIIHEFAHAIMDYNYENKGIDISCEFFRWVEEPFANWFVLKYFYSYGSGDTFKQVADFIKGQPPNYRLGWNFYNSLCKKDKLWKDWRNKKASLDAGKSHKWLKKAQTFSQADIIINELNELLNKQTDNDF